MKMKTIFTMVAGTWFLCVASGCALAQELTMPAVPITVEACVRDPDGRPVSGATVHLSLPRYRMGDINQSTDGVTNKAGEVTITGVAQQDYGVSASKEGYYFTTGPDRSINTDKGFKQYAVGVQKIELMLRPIQNPIVGISKNVDRLRLPAFDKPLGFDLVERDWVAPYGNGKTADFIFTVGGYFKSINDYDQSLTLTFSNKKDGISLIKITPRIGSSFRFPYEAALDGYESQRVWRKTFDGKSRATNIDNSGEANYIFRVRTELDERGNVRRAMYGVISSEVIIGGNNEIGRNVSFTYALNPDWTRNIEFDPAKVATSPR